MKLTNEPSRRRPRRRQGAVFLILVVLVLLVVVGSTKTLVQSESAARLGEADRLRVRILSNAIRESTRVGEVLDREIRLPLDTETKQSILVTVDTEADQIIATWFKDKQIIDRLRMPLTQSTLEPQP